MTKHLSQTGFVSGTGTRGAGAARGRDAHVLVTGFVTRVTLASTALALVLAACDDAPGAPSGPGDDLVDNSMQDAVAQYTQDATLDATGAAYDGTYGNAGDTGLDALGASPGYMDVSSPQNACASCSCDKRIGFCLENGTSRTVVGSPSDAGLCPFAAVGDIAVGCNTLSAACLKNPTCECVLNFVQPPLGCYPQCTTSAGYIDVFCQSP